MTQKIIAGFDGNDGGRDALALAVVLADATDAELTVTTAYSYRRTAHDAPDAWHKLIRDDAAERLEGARQICGSRPRTSFVVSRGSSPADGLHQLAEQLEADVVVVGENRLGPLGRIAVGSVTEQTLHGAPCAVVVAPAGYAVQEQQRLQTIGVAYDPAPEARHALDRAVELARTTGARLRVIHVLPKEIIWYAGYAGAALLPEMREDARRQLESTAAAIEGVPEVETLLLEGDPATELGRVAEHLDLLVIGSRGRGPVQRVMLGSVSSRLVRHAHCPLLVFPRSAVPEEPAAPVIDDDATANGPERPATPVG